jgi:superfamily II DNA or RNA helicase
VDLTDFQKNIVKYFHNINSLLLALPTGYGKTIIAIAIAESYLKDYPLNKVVVISPASLVQNFHKESEYFGLNISYDRYTFFSFDKFMNLDKVDDMYDCSKTLLIIDEVHTLRNLTGIRYNSAMKCAINSHKVLLLTATPIINSTQDLVSIINLLQQEYIMGLNITKDMRIKILNDNVELPVIFNEDIPFKYRISYNSNKAMRDRINIEQLTTMKPLLDRHVIYQPKTVSNDFPTYKIYTENIEMSQSYYENYVNLMKGNIKTAHTNPNAFYNIYRKAVNKLGSEYFSAKLYTAISSIKNKQTIIYTNWLEYGSHILKNLLESNNITYGIISGIETLKQRLTNMNKFNNGEIQVMIITKAGSEGLDFKNVRVVIILDPAWSPSILTQIIGRAVRYKSHDSLPINERNVSVYYLNLIEPNTSIENSISGDIILYKIVERKELIIDTSNEILGALSSTITHTFK